MSFEVRGRPQPAGSKRAFPIKRTNGRMGVAVTDDNPQSRDWKTDVASAAFAAMDGDLLDGPLGLACEFTLRRPKGHFGTGRNSGSVKSSAPPSPITKPDTTKLLRAIEDAMSGIVWRDDAQVVEQAATKVYGEPEGVRVAVWTL